MYWILANELVDEDNDADLSGEANIDLGGAITFDEGISTSRLSIPDIILTLDSDSRIGRMTDYLAITELYGLVFSLRLRELLEEMGVNNIEYYNLDIVNPRNGDKYSDYKIANVVGLVDCIDTERSDLKYFDDGDIKRIRKMYFDESRIPPDLRIFRLAKRSILTVVHQSIKDAITEAEITGCVFYKPEEYH
jgi:hypothetical protein